MAEETIPFAGSVELESVVLVSVASKASLDITNQVAQVKIYENIFEPFVTAKVTLKDSADLVEKVPIRGEELIHIRARTPSFDRPRELIDYTFFVNKMSDLEHAAERSMVYVLHLISAESITAMNRRYSRSFEGLISDIVHEIMIDEEKGFGIHIDAFADDNTHYFTKYGIEPTINKLKYISNNWSPLKNLQFLAKHALNENLAPNYTLFMNSNGFHFVSLDTLMGPENKPAFNFMDNNYSRVFDNQGLSTRNVILDYSRVQDSRVPTSFNSLRDMANGTFASKEFSHDLVTKRYEEIEFNYNESFDATHSLNPEPLRVRGIRDEGEGLFNHELLYKISPEAYGTFHKFGKHRSIDLKRISLMEQMKAQEIEIDVFGRTDYTVGQKVTLITFKEQPPGDNRPREEAIDYHYSGNYLVTGLVHVIERDSHNCTLNLAKDSYIREGKLG